MALARHPLSVTLVAYLFLASGIVGIAYHARELATPGLDAWLVLFVRVLAIVAGAGMLRGANWARWLAIVWMAYHVVLSAWHSTSELITHVAVFVVVAYALTRADARMYFRRPS